MPSSSWTRTWPVARRKYGSKAAYEAERGPIREANREFVRRYEMTEEERAAEDAKRAKARALDRLEGDEGMMTWMIFAAAAVAGGANAQSAGKVADAMIGQAKQRFT